MKINIDEIELTTPQVTFTATEMSAEKLKDKINSLLEASMYDKWASFSMIRQREDGRFEQTIDLYDRMHY